MTKKETHICTECLFLGTPSFSAGRLLLELLINLVFLSFSPIFGKVRHCPDCGRHSMVAVDSEAGLEAIARLEKEGKSEAPAPDEKQRRSSDATQEQEYLRIRMQR